MSELSDWPTKPAAAATLQCSVRVLERRIAAGEIEARPRKRPGARRELVCNPADIAALMPAAFVVPAQLPAEPAATPQPLSKAAPQPLDALAAIASAMFHAAPAPSQAEPKIWLTLAEAAELTGLSRAFLRREIRLGTIRAVRDRTWKLHRPSLMSF